MNRPAHPPTAAAPVAPLRLGVRAHDFGRLPAKELAALVAAGGFASVQLALNKAVAGLNLRAGELTEDLAQSIGAAFRQQGVAIAVLGCYINPIHPDRETRSRSLAYFKDHLRFARAFGCGLVALESGSVNADYSPHPDNHRPAALRELLGSLAELVATAQEHGVKVGLEAVTSHPVSTPGRMRRVLDSLQSEHLQVVWDPVNLLSPENAGRQAAVSTEALELFGDRIAVVHAKDFLMQDGLMSPLPAGCGQLDYGPVLEFVRQGKGRVPVLLEETDAPAAGCSAAWLRARYQKI